MAIYNTITKPYVWSYSGGPVDFLQAYNVSNTGPTYGYASNWSTYTTTYNALLYPGIAVHDVGGNITNRVRKTGTTWWADQLMDIIVSGTAPTDDTNPATYYGRGPDFHYNNTSGPLKGTLSYRNSGAWETATLKVGAFTSTSILTGALSCGNITSTGDIAVNGGDVTTTAATATLFNTGATLLSIGGAATTLSIGAATGTTTINNANTVITGDLAINGGDLTSSASTFNLLTSGVSALYIGNAATTLSIGKTTGSSTLLGSIVYVGSNATPESGSEVTVQADTVNLIGVTAISGSTTVTGKMRVTGNASSVQPTTTSATAEDWNVSLATSNVHFKKVTGTHADFDVSILQLATDLKNYIGSTFIISILNNCSDSGSITVTFKDAVMHGVNNTTATLAINEGLSYTGVILGDDSSAYMYGVVAEISKNLLS